MATTTRSLFVLTFLVIAIGFQIHIGSAAHIEINPDKLFETPKEPVNISCVPDVSGVMVKKMMALEISKSGENNPIVVAKLNSAISPRKGIGNRFEIRGQVLESPDDSYLNVTLLDPKMADSGMYTCVMYFMDQTGLVTDESDSKNLTVEKDAVSSLLNVIEKQRKMLSVLDAKVTRLPQLQSSIAGLGTIVGQLRQELSAEKNTVTGLTTSIGQLRQKISLQETEIASLSDLKRKVVGLTEKVSCQSAFAATTLHPTDPGAGHTIQFPQVIMRVGQGYDENTGVYTAPMNGLYNFNLAVEVGCDDCWYLIDLKVNSEVVGILKTADEDYTDQSSISTVVKLDRWDKVQAVIKSDHSTRLTNAKTVLFNGFLIKCF